MVSALASIPARRLVDGATAIVEGALDAGCTFFAGYPITPASPIHAAMLRELPRRGGVAVQGEDEIASIGMCIGASLAGARAMTATSGPGISLYSENIGFAIMAEAPLVVVDVQRLGPATGGATTVAQGDVQFLRWGTAGGMPVVVLAPSTIPECYTLTFEAFELAQRLRCPVFVATDKELNLTVNTLPADAWEPRRPSAAPSPERVFGGRDVVRVTGSTHDERGFITKHTETVGELNRRLAAKIELHARELERVDLDSDPGARTLVVSYGVTAGAVRSAAREARARGTAVAVAIVQSLWPLPEASLRAAIEGVERIVVAELNLGQYRREVERLADGREVVGVHRVDGTLISPADVLEVLV